VSEVKELREKRVNLKMTITPITSILRHLYAPINFTVKQETAAQQQKKMHDNGSTIREKIKQKSAVAADAAAFVRSLLQQQVKPIERPTTNSAANQYENACSERAKE